MHEKEIHTDGAKPIGSEGSTATDRGVSAIHQPFGRLEEDADGCSEQIGGDPPACGSRTQNGSVKFAYVYVFSSTTPGLPIKVGVSGTPAERLIDVKKNYPHLTSVVFSRRFKRADAYRVESMTFDILGIRRLKNEMFNVSVDRAIKAVEAAMARCGVAHISTEKSGELKVSISLRILPKVKRLLEEHAAEGRWTLSKYIEIALKEHVDAIHAGQAKRTKKIP